MDSSLKIDILEKSDRNYSHSDLFSPKDGRKEFQAETFRQKNKSRRVWRWLWGGSKYSGMACMAVSSIFYSLMGLFVKLLSVGGIPALEIVLVRCGVICILAALHLYRMGHPLLGSKRVRHLVVARAAIGFISLSTFFYSIELLPLRDATVLNFTTPVFTALIATVRLGEKWGLGEMAGTLSSFLGVLLIMRPDSLFFERRMAKREAMQQWHEIAGVFLALAAAATGAFSYVIVRAVGQTGEPPMVCVFAFAAFSAPLAGLGLLLSQNAKLPSGTEAAKLLAVGFSAYAAQVFLTRGLQVEKAPRASSIQYIKVLATYALGVAFLQEVPTLGGILGAVLIAASAAFLACGNAS